MRIVLIALLLLVNYNAKSQCPKSWNKFDKNDELAVVEKSFSPDLINKLKATTTVFFYKENDADNLELIKSSILSGWDFNKIIFAKFEDLPKYSSDSNYSYFTIHGNELKGTMGNAVIDAIHYYLILQIGGLNTNFCRIELCPNIRTLSIHAGAGHPYNTQGAYQIKFLYNEGVFYNWNPIFLKAHLSVVSNNLKNGIRLCAFDKVKDKNILNSLANDTLYFAKSNLIHFGTFTGKESSCEESLFTSYHFPFRMCSDEELYQIFQVEKRGKFLFEYVKSSGFKFISIYDVKNGIIAYRKYVNKMFKENLRESDLKEIK